MATIKTSTSLSVILAAPLLITGCAPQDAKPYRPDPDLVSSITAPRTSERFIPVTVHESNQGSLFAGNHVIRVYLLDRSREIQLQGGHFNTVGLPAGQSRSFRLNLRAPRHIRSGSYRLCVSTDALHNVRESREHNNISCRSIWINNGPATPPPPQSRYPDLVSSIMAPAHAGRSIPVTVRDTNLGRHRGAGYHTIHVYLRRNGRSFPVRGGTISARRLQAGQSRSYSTRVSVSPGLPWGRYRLCATTDGNNRISESNERNNTSCRPIILTRGHVAPPPPPARHSPDLSVHISAASHNGRRFPVTVRDTNLGARPAGRHSIRIYLKQRGRIIALRGGYIRASALRVRDFRSYRTTVTAPAIPNGRYRLCASTDDGNYIAERNERNNTHCKPVWISSRHSGVRPAQPPRPARPVPPPARPAPAPRPVRPAPVRLPDLAVRHSAPASFRGDINLQVSVSNKGNWASGSYRITAFLLDGRRRITLHRGSRQVPALQAGLSRTYHFSLEAPRIPSNRSYQLCVKVDSSNQVRESNEGNNRWCSRIYKRTN